MSKTACPLNRDSTVLHYCVGNHTFAILRGAENYTLIKEGLRPIIDEINSLIEQKVVEVDGEIIELKFYLGGDYKVCMYT